MSSHHIIRENQETGLFLVDSKAIKKDVLESFFEWSPIIVTTEETFIELHQKGYKVDALVCERGFKINFETELAMQQPIDLITVKNSGQIVSEGIKYLVDKKSPSIHIFIESEPELVREVSDSFSEQSILFIDQNKKTQNVKGGAYEKWLPKNATIQISPNHPKQEVKVIMKDEKNEKFAIEKDSTITNQKDGIIKIKSKESFVLTETI